MVTPRGFETFRVFETIFTLPPRLCRPTRRITVRRGRILLRHIRHIVPQVITEADIPRAVRWEREAVPTVLRDTNIRVRPTVSPQAYIPEIVPQPEHALTEDVHHPAAQTSTVRYPEARMYGRAIRPRTTHTARPHRQWEAEAESAAVHQ